MTERALALVAGFKPLADAGHVEFVLAVLARHARETLVGGVHHTVADHAVFHALDLLVQVALPKKHCRDNVTVPLLKQVFDCEHPLVLLGFAHSDLLSDFCLD